MQNAVGAIAAAALVAVGLASAAHGSESTPDANGTGASAATASEPAAALPLTVLLMGDSYTAGNGARDQAGHSSYYGPGKCMRSRDTWGEQYADSLQDQGYAVTLLNRACSAANTDNMLHDRYLKRTEHLAYPAPEPVGAARSHAFYADWAASNPACVPTPDSEEFMVTTVTRGAAISGERSITVSCARWLRAQVDALNPDVDLILFTVGGNDGHFPDIMRQCLVMVQVAGCDAALREGERYLDEDFAEDLGLVFDAMHAGTDGQATVVYLGYPGLEAHSDLTLSAMVDGQVVQLAVGARLEALLARGADVQRAAVDAANARHGHDFVTYLDGLPELFAGHEPDARPGVANPDRWIAEPFDTTVKDEWYHFRPAGQAAIAQYVAGYGAFGASGQAPARDLALVTDGSPEALAAVLNAARNHSVAGAHVSIVEQRRGPEGVGIEQRIVVQGLDPEQARAWESSPDHAETEWVPAAELALPARWNAVQQVLFVGDASMGTGHLGSLWSGSAQGRLVTADVAVVDTSSTPLAVPGKYHRAASDPQELVGRALDVFAAAPHAWVSGPFATVAAGTVSLDAGGSFGPGALAYAWDVDADGIFEQLGPGQVSLLDAAAVRPGWVAVKVTAPGGAWAVSRTWVTPGFVSFDSGNGACAGEVATAGAHSAPGSGVASAVGRGGSDACEPGVAQASWRDLPEAVGDQALPSSGTAAQAASGNFVLLDWLADPQLYTEERTSRAFAISLAAGKSGTRASSPSRRRPRELVQRELGLRVLLGSPTREGALA